MNRYTRRTLVMIVVLLLCAHAPANAQRTRRPAAGRTSAAQRTPDSQPAIDTRPRLILVLVADQFRHDYLDRFGDLFIANGFRRLMREGALWTNVNYDHTPTYTAPGHATLLTGTYPAENGIIGNEWFDRERGRNTTSVADPQTRLLGGAPDLAGSSPRRLLASTLGDELRLATNNKSKVIGISVKDRGAILPAGRLGNAAYWFSTANGAFVSSNYYFNELPAWVSAFNARRPADEFFNRRWERLLPEAEYIQRAGQDAPVWEQDSADGANAASRAAFPHTILGTNAAAPDRTFYEALDYSPFSNDLLANFALEAIRNEQLGADEATDILTLSFSANDYVGHRYGPYSHEVMDITLRTDRLLAELLTQVEQVTGQGRTLVVFTADHGVAPIPEHAAALNLPGGRIRETDLLGAIRNRITARYNSGGITPDPTADYILAFKNNNIYFNTAALSRDRVDRSELERLAGEAALTVPGITRYFTRTQLEAAAISPADATARRVLHGFHPRRSGEVVILQDPFKYIVEGTLPATHGTPYSYDTRVPLIIAGARIRSNVKFTDAATPADIAPTLAALLNLQPPSNSTGRVLMEALTRTER